MTTEEREKMLKQADTMTIRQIADDWDLSYQQAKGRLRRMQAKPVPTYPPCLKLQAVAGVARVVLSVESITSILENYFGMPLHLDTVSCFARDRLRSGISFLLMRRHSLASIKQIAAEHRTSDNQIKDLIAYAESKASNQIIFLTQKIKDHAKGTPGNTGKFCDERAGIQGDARKGKGVNAWWEPLQGQRLAQRLSENRSVNRRSYTNGERNY